MAWKILVLAIVCRTVDAARLTRKAHKETSTGAKVSTTFGAVIGKDESGCQSFKGIPFAEAPVGNLRFAKPKAWSQPYPQSGLVAQEFGIQCIQTSTLLGESSEDCLFLNVYRPSGVQAGAKLPVMVWIHGGAFFSGSGGEGYDGCSIAVNQGVIVASMNYRLSIFGFGAFETGGSILANVGMDDQREALRWLRQELNAFGGDGEKITLFGESAGGISIYHHLVTAPSRGLFRAAIIQSGFPAAKETGPAVAQTLDMGVRIGCTNKAALLECLRSKNANDLQYVDDDHEVFKPDVRLFQRWEPTIDGVELPDHPYRLLSDGKSAGVSILVGSNTDEANLFIYPLYLVGLWDGPYRDFLKDTLGNFPGNPKQELSGAEIEQVYARYPGRRLKDNRLMAGKMATDSMFMCATRFAARIHSKHSPSFVYRFNFRSQTCSAGLLEGTPGVFHAYEIGYPFGNVDQTCLEPEGLQLSARMQKYWADFAKNLKPGGSWPAYTSGGKQELVLQASDQIQDHYKEDFCQFWEETLFSKTL